MTVRRSTVLPMLLAAALLVGPTAASAQKIDPQAETALRSMTEYLTALDRFAFTARLTIERKAGAQTQASTRTYRFTVAWPDRLAARPVGEGAERHGSLVVREGKVLAYAPVLTKLAEHEAPALLDEVVDSVEMSVVTGDMNRFVAPLLKADARGALLADADAVRYVGKEQIGDTPAHRIRIERTGGAVDWWIAAEGDAVPLKIAPDVSDRVARARAAGQDLTLDVAVRITEFVNAVEPDEKTFEVDAPETVARVESLFEGPRMGPRGSATALVGKPAPAFDLDSIDGPKVKLADLKGKTVILDFWASWCGPCRAGLPILVELAAEFEQQGVVLYAINMEEGPEKIQPFLKQLNVPLNVLLDRNAEVAGAYGVRAIPHTVIVDAEGVVRDVHVGLAMKDAFRRNLQAVLDGEKDDVPADEAEEPAAN